MFDRQVPAMHLNRGPREDLNQMNQVKDWLMGVGLVISCIGLWWRFKNGVGLVSDELFVVVSKLSPNIET